MKLTFCDLLQIISGFFYLYSLSLIIWEVFIKEKKNDIQDFIAAKVFLKIKKIILNDLSNKTEDMIIVSLDKDLKNSVTACFHKEY